MKVCEHRGQIDASGTSTDEKCRIDRRLKQRKLPHVSLDVHAMANLEESVLDNIPKPKKPSFMGTQNAIAAGERLGPRSALEGTADSS